MNLASRLEGANKVYGTRNLVSERTIASVGAAVEVREVDRIVVEGQTRPEVVFEILGRQGEVTPQRLRSRDLYEEGLAAYRGRRWDDALDPLTAALELAPGDGPSLALVNRIEFLKENPPCEDWDGSRRIEK